MKPILRIALVAVTLLGLLMSLAPRPAAAHPMGNFSINQWSSITISSSKVDIHYVVDMAEIPTYTELGSIRPDRSISLTDVERATYISTKSADLLNGLSLTIDGAPAHLTVGSTALSFPLGSGGLPTLRFEMSLSSPVNGLQTGVIEYKDSNFTDRIGWKEIIANPGEGASLKKSNVPSTDLSKSLTQYNPDLLSTAPTTRTASITFLTGIAASQASLQGKSVVQNSASLPEADWIQQQTRAITGIFSQKDLPFGALLLALLLAFGVGAAHALSPGHGKTVVAAYMVGSRGTPIHALLLGVTVTASHTIGVFLLGFIVLALANYILPETLYPWLKFISGALLALLGMTLFVQRFRAWKSANRATVHTHSDHTHDHDHPHEHSHEDGHVHSHDHDHDHSHDTGVPHKHGPFGRAHTHLPADGQKVSLGALLALGITGGIIPCPSALMVLLVAVQFEKVGLGLLLILAFSFGLAAVLTGIGLLMVYSRHLLNRIRFSNGLLVRLPMVSALAVCCLGLFLAYGALTTP